MLLSIFIGLKDLLVSITLSQSYSIVWDVYGFQMHAGYAMFSISCTWKPAFPSHLILSLIGRSVTQR
jgi:hypothetical protein